MKRAKQILNKPKEHGPTNVQMEDLDHLIARPAPQLTLVLLLLGIAICNDCTAILKLLKIAVF